jgi:hypothetical protein
VKYTRKKEKRGNEEIIHERRTSDKQEGTGEQKRDVEREADT